MKCYVFIDFHFMFSLILISNVYYSHSCIEIIIRGGLFVKNHDNQNKILSKTKSLEHKK